MTKTVTANNTIIAHKAVEARTPFLHSLHLIDIIKKTGIKRAGAILIIAPAKAAVVAQKYFLFRNKKIDKTTNNPTDASNFLIAAS